MCLKVIALEVTTPNIEITTLGPIFNILPLKISIFNVPLRTKSLNIQYFVTVGSGNIKYSPIMLSNAQSSILLHFSHRFFILKYNTKRFASTP